jgi:hypothetical protein
MDAQAYEDVIEHGGRERTRGILQVRACYWTSIFTQGRAVGRVMVFHSKVHAVLRFSHADLQHHRYVVHTSRYFSFLSLASNDVGSAAPCHIFPNQNVQSEATRL